MNQTTADKNLVEKLADYAHNAWSGWMKYLFEKSTLNKDGTVTIPKWAVERWTGQMNTPYTELPEEMKSSDRKEAGEMIDILNSLVSEDAPRYWTCNLCGSPHLLEEDTEIAKRIIEEYYKEEDEYMEKYGDNIGFPDIEEWINKRSKE